MLELRETLFLYRVSSNSTSSSLSIHFLADITSEMDPGLSFSLCPLSSILDTRTCSLGMYIEHADFVTINKVRCQAGKMATDHISTQGKPPSYHEDEQHVCH